MSMFACGISVPTVLVYSAVEYNKLGPWAYAFCLPAMYIPLTLIGVNSYLNAKYKREHPSSVYQSSEEFVNGEYKKLKEHEKHK